MYYIPSEKKLFLEFINYRGILFLKVLFYACLFYSVSYFLLLIVVMDSLSAFIIIFILGLITVFCCLISLKIIYSHFRSCFGYLCAAQCIAEAGMGLCYGLYAAPVCLMIGESEDSRTSINLIIGQINLYCNFATMLLLLMKSLNRFHAIIFPIHYRNKISTFHAKISVAAVAIFSFICIIPFFDPLCNLYFNTVYYIWFNLGCREGYLAGFAHLGVLISVVVGTILLDGTTLSYMVLFRTRLQQSSNTNFSKEKKFFFQTCIATIFNVIAFLCTYILVYLSSEQLLQFFLSTPQWLLFNISNEVSFICFYYLSTRKRTSKITVVPTSVHFSFRSRRKFSARTRISRSRSRSRTDFNLAKFSFSRSRCHKFS